MFSVDVKFDVKKLTKKLDRIQKKQIPFATAVALTKTAKAAQKDLEKQTLKDLDRPTRFTQRAFGIKPARKNNLAAVVFIKDKQAKYLRLQIRGGTRKPERKAEVVPVAIKLNKFGNIPGRHRGKIAKLLNRKDTFVSNINGLSGIWQRKAGRLTLLAAFKKQVTYQKRFRFEETVAKTVKRVFPRRFKIEMAKALKTAR